MGKYKDNNNDGDGIASKAVGAIATIIAAILIILIFLFITPFTGGWDFLNVTGRDSVRNPETCLFTYEEDGKVKCGLF